MDQAPHSKSYTTPTTLAQHTTEQVITAFVFTQMSAAAGIKLYGKPAVDAVLMEFLSFTIPMTLASIPVPVELDAELSA